MIARSSAVNFFAFAICFSPSVDDLVNTRTLAREGDIAKRYFW